MEKQQEYTALIVPAVTDQAGQCRIVVAEGRFSSALTAYRKDPDAWREVGHMNSQGYVLACDPIGNLVSELKECEPLMAATQLTFVVSREAAVEQERKAKLVPVKMEVPRPSHGKPGYAWVDGFKVVTPEGSELQPYMRVNEAKRFCKDQGWSYEIVDPNRGMDSATRLAEAGHEAEEYEERGVGR